MAKNTAAVLDEELHPVEELTTKQVINEGIARVIDATGIDIQKNRYKAMRAIAYEAFAQAIENGTFDDLVDAAIVNVDDLPAGWEIERSSNEEAKAPAKPVAKKAAAKPVSKTAEKAPAKKAPAKAAPAKTARKRPTR